MFCAVYKVLFFNVGGQVSQNVNCKKIFQNKAGRQRMKHTRKTIATLLIYPLIGIVTLMVTSCNKDNPTSSPPAKTVLVPLTVGNNWSYQVTGFVNGELIEGFTDTVVVRIVDKLTVNTNGSSYEVGIEDLFRPRTNSATDFKWLDWNGNDGFYRVGGVSSTDTLIQKFLNLKFPVNKGENWRVPLLVYNFGTNKFSLDDTLTYTCISIDSTFETLAGTFQSYVYNYSISKIEDDVVINDDIYEYYSPGIGLVGRETKDLEFGIIRFRQILYDHLIR